ALSTTIVHLIGVRGIIEDKAILAEAATEPLIRMIHQSDEKISKCGSKLLGDLIEENEIIRHSLLSTGFAQIVLHTLSPGTQPQQQSSSSSQTDTSIPIHVKNGILDVLLKLVTTAEGLEPLSVLIPILEEMKTNGEQELKNKAKKILSLFAGEGIKASSSSLSSKQNDIKIHELEDSNKQMEEQIKQKNEQLSHKDEELRRERDENERINQELLKERQEKEKEKKKANDAEARIQNIEQEKNKLKQENTKFKENKKEIKLQSPQDVPFPLSNSRPIFLPFEYLEFPD
ncbi:MAG: hypothetical protein EZS28_049204, partial [Streblomastix strix]